MADVKGTRDSSGNRSSALQHGSVYQPAMTEEIPQRMRRSPNFSLALLGLAMFGVMGPFTATVALQSTLNYTSGVGVASVAVYYSASLLSSIFVFLCFQVRHWRIWLAISLSCHILYVVLNFYPTWFTLIPAALVAGALSGVGVRLLNKAIDLYIYEQQLRTGSARDVIRRHYRSWVFAMEWLGVLLCAVLAGTILKDTKNCYHIPTTYNRISGPTLPTLISNRTVTPPANITNAGTASTAAVAATFTSNNTVSATTTVSNTNAIVASASPPKALPLSLAPTGPEYCASKGCAHHHPCAVVNTRSIYGVMGVYTLIGIVVVVLLVLFTEQPVTSSGVASASLPVDTPAATPTIEENKEFNASHDNSHALLTDGDEVSQLGDKVREHPRQRATRRAQELVQLLKDPRVLLMSPLWLAVGHSYGLYLADFTRYYVYCPLHVSHIGFTLACFALALFVTRVVCDYACSKRPPPRLLLVIVGVLLHLIILITMLAWKGKTGALPAVYSLSCIWGLAQGLLTAQMDGLEHEIAPEHQEKVHITLRVARTIGLVIAFGLSGAACMAVKASIGLVLLLIGTGLFLWTIIKLLREAKKEQDVGAVHM